MNHSQLLRLLPTMGVIVEAFRDAGWACEGWIRDPQQIYRGIRLYHGQKALQPDVLYLLRPTEGNFPTEEFSYISGVPIGGGANHFVCPDQADEKILDFVLELFADFQQQEQMLDQLIYRHAGLQELCQLGSRLLGNPVCIHDDWFMVIAMSQGLEEILPPEYIYGSSVGYIPRMILDDFRYDSEYLETYTYREARIWENGDGTPESLYVNLWDGAVYLGRMLVIRHDREFKQSDYILAEVLTQRAVMLLRQQRLGEQKPLRSMDDVIYNLLRGGQQDSAEIGQLMDMLRWKKDDHFLCIRIRNQNSAVTTVMEHVLHSDLFRLFPESYILFGGHEQCVILNLTRDPVSDPMIRHRLAPICRDCGLYAGISSPVNDIRDLQLAYYQANVALEQTFRVRNEKWLISFSECAMDHILEKLDTPLPNRALVSPELLALIEHDRQEGTQYFETLRTFLLNERDIPKTSETLIIHRTTLLYRLKKIRSMLHANLEDPDQRLYLLLSLWILEKEDQMRKS